MYQYPHNPQQQQQRGSNKTNPVFKFQVFADPVRNKSALSPTRRATTNNAHAQALQEVDVNKAPKFRLSPNSQVYAEKENFDPIRKHLVRYQQNPPAGSNTKRVPLDETKSTLVLKTPKHDRHLDILSAAETTDNNGQSATPTNRILSQQAMKRQGKHTSPTSNNTAKQKQQQQQQQPCKGNPRSGKLHNAQTEVDDLVLFLSSLSMGSVPANNGKKKQTTLFSKHGSRPKAPNVLSEKPKDPQYKLLPPPPRPRPRPSSLASKGNQQQTKTDNKHTQLKTGSRAMRQQNSQSAVILTPPELKHSIR